MRALDRKLTRDIRRLWAQALAIAAVLSVGVMIMVMAFGTQRSLTETRDTFYDRARFADIWATAARAPRSLTEEIAAIPGVARLEARVSTSAVLDLPDMADPVMAQVLSIPPSGAPEMNALIVKEGRLPGFGRRDEVVVNEAFANAHDYRPGQVLSVTLNGQKRDVTITGIVLSPEFIYTIGPGSIMPDDERFGILWMAEDVLAGALNLGGAFNSIALSVTRGTALAPVQDALDDLLKPYGGTGSYDRSQQMSNAFLDGELEQLGVMARIVPPIFLVVSAFLVNMVLGRMIQLEREQIGLLKALGYSTVEIAFHYLKLSLGIGAIGVVIGWLAGLAASQAMASVYVEYFHFPYLVFVQRPSVYVIGASAGLAAAGIGALLAVRRIAGLSPAVAMSPPAPTRFRRGLFDRMIVILRPRQPTMMILRAIGRWPLRAALTSLGISVSGAIIVAGLFMFDSFDELLDVAFVQANRQDAILTFAAPRPEVVLDAVEDLPGVLMSEGSLTLPARLHHGHLTRTVGIEAARPGNDLVRVFDGDARVEVAPENGIVLAKRLAAHLDAKPGDVIEIEFLQEGEDRFPVVITGTVAQFFGLSAYMELDTVSALLNQAPRVSLANVEIDTARSEDLFEAFKSAPAISGITYMSEIRRGFDETIAQSAGITMTVYTFMAALIAIGVVYNSARIQLSERARELASLRILGFTRGEVSYILLGELFILTAVAIPVGLVMGYGMAAAMVQSFESDLYALPLIVTETTYWRAAGVVTGATLVSALIVRRRIDRMDLVAVMKTRE
ncbi:ABC transporter permease [Maritimibacter sp. DP1N21-5]|uniref:ABC transporter permease n=1 Tax=Maritimibacter sp. DP1N21-5 TaxID=2836867 RepID=UPI002102DE6D|nr:FtsX-like permease family protein [Maritimibacter sp. DP1N21-5]